MRGKKKKSIEELVTEVKELIANSGRSKDDIHTDYIAYRALKKRIDNPDSRRYDDDIRRMKELYNAYLLGMSIYNRQNKINAARKVAAAAIAAAASAAAAAATIATSNVTNTASESGSTTQTQMLTQRIGSYSRPSLMRWGSDGRLGSYRRK